MDSRIKTATSAMANYSGFLDAYAFFKGLAKPKVVILLYHRVSPDPDSWYLAEPVSPQDFEKQIEDFSRSYELLPLDKLARYLKQGKALPKKAVVITLDDGYQDNYLHAYPILKKHHVPATIFLTTGHIGTERLFWYNKVKYIIKATRLVKANLGNLGNFRLQSRSDRFNAGSAIVKGLSRIAEGERNTVIKELAGALKVKVPDDLGKKTMLSWSEVREMSHHGITFGAHTVSHPILTTLPLSQAKREIAQSKKDIEEKLGQTVTAFAYPSGGPGDFNSRIANLVRESGFLCAVTAVPHWISPKAKIYELGRMHASGDRSQFKVLLSGLYGDLGLHRWLQ
jgi:peptidoglycan/xylan/chitin deacetylase (PgdA/CDA1 family)